MCPREDSNLQGLRATRTWVLFGTPCLVVAGASKARLGYRSIPRCTYIGPTASFGAGFLKDCDMFSRSLARGIPRPRSTRTNDMQSPAIDAQDPGKYAPRVYDRTRHPKRKTWPPRANLAGAASLSWTEPARTAPSTPGEVDTCSRPCLALRRVGHWFTHEDGRNCRAIDPIHGGDHLV